MEALKQKFINKARPVADEVKKLSKKHGNVVIDNVTLNQILTGMKGVVSLLTVTSKLDPVKGIKFRGYSIPDLREKLPKAEGGVEPLPEGLFHLMLLNELPNDDDVKMLSNEWAKRSDLPQYVMDILDAFPVDAHPMTQFTSAIAALSTQSKFAKAYRDGIPKINYWDSTLEDVMDLIARLPRIAAYIYRRSFHNGDHIAPDPKLDWAANLAHMMGFKEKAVHTLLRLYMVIHADHEGGNVSAHAAHLVGSALSDPYYSYAAGMAGLAGPLHGLANQEVIRWVFDMIEDIGKGDSPSQEDIAEYVNKTLNEGKVVPGYGHAVLRATDPRYTAQRDFALKYMPDDKLFKVISDLYTVVPAILGQVGKIKNPWPNVDAHSGVLLLHYGIKEYDFYTVLFGVSRALGVLAQLTWDRVIGTPIERPKSQSLHWLKGKAQAALLKDYMIS